ncbi:unnamed protein product [Acanthoscelides obtectus]|uniref:Uncharacterized protein n=1 Tax=Acanthoscelides obtectus TaxID=200917 RepID=A0A9P0QA25_ACAOB|nr:unnamed protein product [Acanthoscelides obtectus]CAK1659623.1 hypothetical protein AOBTE_LOCUS21581 [Acanthoscelides obtectus]
MLPQHYMRIFVLTKMLFLVILITCLTLTVLSCIVLLNIIFSHRYCGTAAFQDRLNQAVANFTIIFCFVTSVIKLFFSYVRQTGFLHINSLRGQRFQSPEEVLDAFKNAVLDLPANEWNKCFENWFERMQMSINLRGEYFEKQ